MSARPTCLRVLAAALLLLGGAAAGDRDSTSEKLQEIRKRIEEVQKVLRTETTRRDSLASKLREVELTEARARRRVEELKRQQAETERERSRLNQERRAVEARLESERRELIEQLRAAHQAGAAGRNEPLKLLFNQQDPARLGRMFAYYGYLGRARAERIESVRLQLERLQALEQELAAAGERLAQLQEQATDELNEIRRARSERTELVRDLEKKIQDRRRQLAQLQQQEETLQKLLTQLQRVTSDFPVVGKVPFEQTKGKLGWPVSGRVVAKFGQPLTAGLKWTGVLLETQRGAEVRAVHYGRVAYADWFNGRGLLIIIDHGDGYMSLYGHNEQLYKSVGEWVEAGEVIAAAGDSGGRGRPELYFEIRKGAKPVDPHQWLRKP